MSNAMPAMGHLLTVGQCIVNPRDVAAAPQTPQLGGGPGQLWGPKLV